MRRTKPIPQHRADFIANYHANPSEALAQGPWRCMECGLATLPGRQCQCLAEVANQHLSPSFDETADHDADDGPTLDEYNWGEQ